MILIFQITNYVIAQVAVLEMITDLLSLFLIEYEKKVFPKCEFYLIFDNYTTFSTYLLIIHT